MKNILLTPVHPTILLAGRITRADVDAAMSWNVLKDKHTMEAVKVHNISDDDKG